MSLAAIKDLSGVELDSNVEPLGVWEVQSVDGVFIKQMHMTKAGTVVPQHSHCYEHSSLLGVGSVRLWQDGKLIGDFKAPIPLRIKAHSKHTFMSLEDNTVIYCIHNTSRTGVVDVDEEHELEV